MKKNLIIIILTVLILFFASIVYANSPARSPSDFEIVFDDIENVSNIQIYGIYENGSEELIREIDKNNFDKHLNKTKIKTERIIKIYTSNKDFKKIYLKIELENGIVLESENVETAEYAVYRYNAENNKFGFTENLLRRPGYYGVFFFIIGLLIPFLSTLLIESAIAIFYKPILLRHVFAINALTNPIMNIVLILFYVSSSFNLIYVILILEIIVAFLEYLYYINKYKEIRKRKLLMFSIVANISSWLIYWGFTTMF